ncbi:MAG: hypothetical protein WBF42_03540 [Terracidiphilus sp.]
MTLLNNTRTWETAAGVALIAAATAGALWWARRKRPAPDEIEHARRTFLASSGRLVDGMLLDVCELEAEGGKLTLLEYSYRIGGADYECSQDITTMLHVIDPAGVRAGFPCSVRYQQSSPQNSIVVAEGWSGLRERMPDLPHIRRAGASALGA